MVEEAAAETVDGQAEKGRLTKVWGKLISQVIREMQNGFMLEAEHQCEQAVETPTRERSKNWTPNSEWIELMSTREKTGITALTRDNVETELQTTSDSHLLQPA